MAQNVEIFFKVDGVEEYITDLEQLDSVLKDVRQATDDVTTATNKLETQDFEALENRVDALDGSVKVLAGSLEIATGALGALGLENEFFNQIEENALNIILLAEGAVNISEGYKLLAKSGKLAAIQQRILNAVTAANPYVLLAGAVIAAGAALAAYTLKQKEAAAEEKKRKEELAELRREQDKQARTNQEIILSEAELRDIRRENNTETLQEIIDEENAKRQAFNDEIDAQIEIVRVQSQRRGLTKAEREEQTFLINKAKAIIEEETEKLKESNTVLSAAEDRLEKLNADKEKNNELTETSTELTEAETLAIEQQSQALNDILDEQGALEEELYLEGLSLRQQQSREIEDEYYRRLALANENEELIAQVEAQFLADKAALKEQFRQEDLDSVQEFNTALIAAEEQLQDAKLNAIAGGFALASELAGDNEKVQNILFAAAKGLEIAQIVTKATADGVAAKSQTIRSVGILSTQAAAGNLAAAALIPGTLAAGASTLASIKLNAAAGIAGIAASTIAKFKNGGTVPDSGPSPSAGGGGGGGPAVLNYQLGNQEVGPDIGIGQTSAGGNLGGGQVPVKAYVIATDVTSAQEANAQIENLARL